MIIFCNYFNGYEVNVRWDDRIFIFGWIIWLEIKIWFWWQLRASWVGTSNNNHKNLGKMFVSKKIYLNYYICINSGRKTKQTKKQECKKYGEFFFLDKIRIFESTSKNPFTLRFRIFIKSLFVLKSYFCGYWKIVFKHCLKHTFLMHYLELYPFRKQPFLDLQIFVVTLFSGGGVDGDFSSP